MPTINYHRAPKPLGPPPTGFADEPRARVSHPALQAYLSAGVPLPSALRRLGLTLWTEGRLGAAAEAMEAAVAADPADSAAWLDLGFCRRGLGDAEGAFEAFERSAAASPTHARAWLALGLAAKEKGDALRAQGALEHALLFDKSLDDAAYSLGLIHFEARRYAQASLRWRPLVARGYKTGLIHAGLGQCAFFLGDFAFSAEMFAAYLVEHPDEETIVARHALVRFLAAALRAGPAAAEAAYLSAAGAKAEPFAKIARAGVLLLTGYGHLEQALDMARWFFRADDPDPIIAHHVAALKGEQLGAASAPYVREYFDRFADNFESQMAALGYRGPEKLLALVQRAGAPARRVLDLGCGAGGAAPFLRPRAERLVGVDLSANMVEKARARGLYDELEVADMVDYLDRSPEPFDLVFAADSLIYLGSLDKLLSAAAAKLSPGGVLAFTLETSTRPPFVLQPSGRFAHSPRAVVAAAAPWFELAGVRRAFLRREGNHGIHGALMALTRRD